MKLSALAKAEKMDLLKKLLLLSAVLRLCQAKWLPEDGAADNPFECHEELRCSKYLPTAGPLDTSDMTNKSLAYPAGTRGEVWHCTENFTSFQWFREVGSAFVPFPWGRAGGMELCDNNQTLVINSVDKSDAGLYAYKVSNGTTERRAYVNLSVSCNSPPPELVTDEHPVQYVTLGESKTFRCAADFGRCKFQDGSVRWRVADHNGTETDLTNSISRHITCAYGQKPRSCNLTFSAVAEEDFGIEFICRLSTPAVLSDKHNYSVHFVPKVFAKNVWLWPGVVLGSVVGGTIICVVIAFFSRRHCYAFRSRLKGEWLYDILVLHGEADCRIVEEDIKPRLTERGYEVAANVGRCGQVAILEQANALFCAHIVMFFFPDEICPGGLPFLAWLARLTHRCSKVIVIHREKTEGLPADHGGETQSLLDKETCQHRSVWSTGKYKSFQHFTWPGFERNLEIDQAECFRELNRFWNSLLNHLPRPQNKDKSEGTADQLPME